MNKKKITIIVAVVLVAIIGVVGTIVAVNKGKGTPVAESTTASESISSPDSKGEPNDADETDTDSENKANDAEVTNPDGTPAQPSAEQKANANNGSANSNNQSGSQTVVKPDNNKAPTVISNEGAVNAGPDITFAGKDLSLSDRLSEFTKVTGYTPSDADAKDTVAPHAMQTVYLHNGNSTIEIGIENTSDNDAKMSACNIVKVVLGKGADSNLAINGFAIGDKVTSDAINHFNGSNITIGSGTVTVRNTVEANTNSESVTTAITITDGVVTAITIAIN